MSRNGEMLYLQFKKDRYSVVSGVCVKCGGEIFSPKASQLCANCSFLYSVLGGIADGATRLAVAGRNATSIANVDRILASHRVICSTPGWLATQTVFNLWEKDPVAKRGGLTIKETRDRIRVRTGRLPSDASIYRAQNKFKGLLDLGIVYHPSEPVLRTDRMPTWGEFFQEEVRFMKSEIGVGQGWINSRLDDSRRSMGRLKIELAGWLGNSIRGINSRREILVDRLQQERGITSVAR